MSALHTVRLGLVLALLGCGPAATVRDAAAPPDASADASSIDASIDAASVPPVETVAVSHDREVRGVWIATVWNINWPSSSSLEPSEQRAELNALLDRAQEAGMNAVFMQVRAESDAFYRSELEPWSRFLTGTQGSDPGWDPLAEAIEAAHVRGLELHAWMNPYRALVSPDRSVAAPNHIANAHPEQVVSYGNLLWIDPGNPGGRAHTLAVIRDVLERYDIDGLHFDDYFYPYPEDGLAFPDEASFAAYDGPLARDDWRRDNVNRMVAAVHELVREVRPDVRFGISPFGIYRPGMPEGIRGLDPWAQLYADPLAWMQAETVDYVAPQLYWPTTQTAQDYARLLTWWSEQASLTGRHLLIGNYLAQLGSSSAWSIDEIGAQLRLVREESRAQGNIQYHIGPIMENRSGVLDVLQDHHSRPAATPPIPGATDAPELPAVTVAGTELTMSGDGRCFALYREVAGAFELERLVFGDRVTLAPGRWAVSLVARNGLESRGVVFEIGG